MIQIHNLKKHFGTVTGLLGPNGNAKTTSPRMIYGLIKPALANPRAGHAAYWKNARPTIVPNNGHIAAFSQRPPFFTSPAGPDETIAGTK